MKHADVCSCRFDVVADYEPFLRFGQLTISKPMKRVRFEDRITMTTPAQVAETYFPGSLSGEETLRKVTKTIEKLGITQENTFFADSVCPEALGEGPGNLPDLFSQHLGEVFHLGGLAGIPFKGQKGFNSFVRQVSEDGHCFILMAPHVSVTDGLELGHSRRDTDVSCEGTLDILSHCMEGAPVPDLATASASPQISFLMSEMLKRRGSSTDEHEGTSKRQAELAKNIWDIAKLQLEHVLSHAEDFGGKDSKLLVLTGIQIQMPHQQGDYFFPMSFDLRLKNGIMLDLFDDTFGFTSPGEYRERPSPAFLEDFSQPEEQAEKVWSAFLEPRNAWMAVAQGVALCSFVAVSARMLGRRI